MAITQTIEFFGTTLRYDQQLLFNGLKLSFPGQNWTTLMGRSGVGKTSILRLLAHLPAPPKTVFSATITPDLSHQVAYMAQEDALLPWLTVLDNSLIGFKLAGLTPDVLLAKDYLRAVGLSDWHKYPSTLSGGMRQRLALVRTLLQNKSYLLMDEPFAALDALTRYDMQQLCKTLLHKKTVIMVSHDPVEAIRLSDQIIVLGGQPVTVLAQFSLPPSDSVRDLNQYLGCYDQLLAVLLDHENKRLV